MRPGPQTESCLDDTSGSSRRDYCGRIGPESSYFRSAIDCAAEKELNAHNLDAVLYSTLFSRASPVVRQLLYENIGLIAPHSLTRRIMYECEVLATNNYCLTLLDKL
jgi:hypothetical protein